MKYVILNTFLVLLFSFSTSCTSLRKAPEDAVEFQGSYYKLFESKSSWHEAVVLCIEKGGYLASVKNAETNDFIVNLTAGKCIWLGASDELKENEWLWRDGSKMIYNNWASHEPDNWYGGKEHTLVVGWPGYPKGQWGDTQAHYRKPIYGFVCEWTK